MVWVGLGLALLALLLALFLLESRPLLDPDRPLSGEEMADARRVLDYGIRSARHADVTNTIDLSAEELDATANYLLKQFVTGIAHFELEDGAFTFTATAQVVSFPAAGYVNLAITAVRDRDRVRLGRVRLGDANLPAQWVEAGLALAQHFSTLAKFFTIADQAVRAVVVQPDRIRVVYRWDSESLQKMRGLVLEVTSKKRLRHYHARLAEIVNQSSLGRRVPLGDLLQPLFALARERSEDHDPIEENRALLVVLSAYLSGSKTAPLLAEQYSATPAQRRTVLLNKRLDLAKHFVISAALAASANSTFADLAGVAKEMDDSHGGSGFNFQDLAADMAGQRLGQLSVASEKSAKWVQKRLSRNADDSVIMPNVRDLPERLSAEEFARRYGQIGSASFEGMQNLIQQRLEALPLYRSRAAG